MKRVRRSDRKARSTVGICSSAHGRRPLAQIRALGGGVGGSGAAICPRKRPNHGRDFRGCGGIATPANLWGRGLNPFRPRVCCAGVDHVAARRTCGTHRALFPSGSGAGFVVCAVELRARGAGVGGPETVCVCDREVGRVRFAAPVRGYGRSPSLTGKGVALAGFGDGRDDGSFQHGDSNGRGQLDDSGLHSGARLLLRSHLEYRVDDYPGSIDRC